MTEYKGSEGDGARILQLDRERKKALAELNARKAELERETERRTSIQSINSKFTPKSTEADEEFTRQTTGLVTVDQFRKRRQLLDALEEEAEAVRRSNVAQDERRRKRPEKVRKTALSFSLDEDEEEDDDEVINLAPDSSGGIKMKKNPDVETSFLPDRERELKETQLRERLAKEWLEEQKRIKSEKIEVTYSYWDGSGHRRDMQCTKGTLIEEFLEKARQEFKELRNISVDNLMYVKEDLIIPHQLSFYDLIVSKARGKSGPLFHFDVHDDVRMAVNTNVEKDESHAGKVVERHWYEKSKHIFPASRWEVYDPAVLREAPYSIHDTLKKH